MISYMASNAGLWEFDHNTVPLWDRLHLKLSLPPPSVLADDSPIFMTLLTLNSSLLQLLPPNTVSRTEGYNFEDEFESDTVHSTAGKLKSFFTLLTWDVFHVTLSKAIADKTTLSDLLVRSHWLKEVNSHDKSFRVCQTLLRTSNILVSGNVKAWRMKKHKFFLSEYHSSCPYAVECEAIHRSKANLKNDSTEEN
ncbi:hypothetical protein STEG23_017021 [Scotinomys teguina]